MEFKLDSKPYNTKRKCHCGGDYWWMYYLSQDINVECDKCGEKSCISPEVKLDLNGIVVGENGSISVGHYYPPTGNSL